MKDARFLVVDPDDGVRHDLMLSLQVIGSPGLLLVALDDRGRTHPGVIWILAELAAGVPLAEQIPTLVELDFDGFQPYPIVIRHLALPVKMLLLVNKAFDLLQDGAIGGRFSHVHHLVHVDLGTL